MSFNLVVVSASSLSAYQEEKRIVGAYLFQTSPTSWMGEINLKLYNALRDELFNAPEGTRCVALYRVSSRGKTLLEVIGSGDILPNGTFVRSKRSLSNIDYLRANKSDLSRILDIRPYAVASGFSHDLGKNNRGFLSQIIHPSLPEGFQWSHRHELLSLECLQRVVENKSLFPDEFSSDGLNRSHPFKSVGPFGLVSDVVSSHHRLPSAVMNKPDDLLRKNAEHIAEGRRYREKATVIEHQFPRLERALVSTLNKARGYPSGWNKNCAFHYTRMAMMVADHTVSSEDTLALESPQFRRIRGASIPSEWLTDESTMNRAYANTMATSQGKRLGSPLQLHLLRVGSRAGRVVEAMANAQWPRLPVRFIDEVPRTPERFKWQDESVRTVFKSNIGPHDGFFGVVTASTGTGKTNLSQKLMRSLDSRGARFNYLLGFRALAAQSGIAYRTSIVPKMAEGDCAILTGGSEAGFITKGGRCNPSLIPHVFRSGLSASEIRLLATPVVVCTIDYLMPAVNFARGGHLVQMLRLSNSDVFIDEIDSYDINELSLIGKLAYFTGLHGRKFVVASATMTEVHAQALFNAYEKGFSEFKMSILPGASLFAGYFAEQPSAISIKKIEGHDAFSKLWHTCSMFQHEGILSSRAKRFVGVLDVSRSVDSNSFHEAIWSKVLGRSEDLYSKACVSGFEFNFTSAFVKFNHTKSAQNFTSYLSLLNERDLNSHGVGVIHLCLHSLFVSEHRSEIESSLALFLNRSGRWQESKHFVEKVTPLLKRGVKKIIFVVSTTPIMEGGRDYCFDLAIVEPSSVGALIQAAGRVLRHRFGEDLRYDLPTHNVFLMSHSFRHLFNKSGRSMPYGEYGPGVEKLEPGFALSKREAASFGANEFSAGVYSSIRLLPLTALSPEAECVERRYNTHVLGLSGKRSIYNLQTFLDSSERLNHSLFTKGVFRGGDTTFILSFDHQRLGFLANKIRGKSDLAKTISRFVVSGGARIDFVPFKSSSLVVPWVYFPDRSCEFEMSLKNSERFFKDFNRQVTLKYCSVRGFLLNSSSLKN